MKNNLMGYSVNVIKDYQERLTEKQKELLVKHCDKYNIYPLICAWYDNMEDFYSDWMSVGYSKEDVKNLLVVNDGGEFKKFKDGQIVRLAR